MELIGLRNCDTCRKAHKALEAAGREVRFVDLRKDGLKEGQLEIFLDRFGGDLINRRSTTWRGLSEAARSASPLDLLAAHPALMKRPVIVDKDQMTLGWSKQVQAQYL